MEGPEIKAVEAIIDNGSFGRRTLRFETGLLAQQADGAVAAYLDDDSMVLSTTTTGSSPKENYDFFPLTVDVEEKMYAAGRIPGSFFRREGRPSTEAILACRIIDRPLRPLFPHTLRNEVQVVETILALNPEDAYDVIALNAASASTLISGLPFGGPVSGVRLALIDGQWVAFPRWSERERAVFEIVVAGRVIENGDVAIAMIEAGAGKNAWTLIYDEGQTKPDTGPPKGRPEIRVDAADKAQVSLADIGRSRFSPVRLLVCVALVLVAVIAPYWLGRMMAVKHTEGIVALLSAVRPQGVAFVAWTVTVVGLTGLAMAVIESRSWLWRAVFVVGLSAEQFIAGMSLLKFEFWHSTRVVYGDAAPLLDAANWGILAAGYAVAVYAVVFVGLLVIVRKDSPLNVLTRSWASFILFYLIEAVALLIVLFGGLLALG